MTLTNELDVKILKLYLRTEINVLELGFQGTQTGMSEGITTQHSRMVK